MGGLLRLKQPEIQNANKDNLIEFRILLSFGNLSDVHLSRVIQCPFGKIVLLFDLHFDNKIHPVFSGGPDVKAGFF